MLSILARMIFQLIPVGCPNHFAVGDVCTLLKLLKDAPENDDLRISNQDLASFFISIEPERFLISRYLLLDFLRPHMNVNAEEVFSVYPRKTSNPGETNNPGDLVKGRIHVHDVTSQGRL